MKVEFKYSKCVDGLAKLTKYMKQPEFVLSSVFSFVLVLGVLCVTATIFAQLPAPIPAANAKDKPVTVTPPAIQPQPPIEPSKIEASGISIPITAYQHDVQTDDGCTLVICQDDLRKFVVFDKNGSIVIDVKTIDISIKRLGTQPRVQCKVFNGVYEPSNPKIVDWSWEKISIVSSEDFQRIIDNTDGLNRK